MTETRVQEEFMSLNPEVRDNWNRNADFWDEHMGEGKSFHLELVSPKIGPPSLNIDA